MKPIERAIKSAGGMSNLAKAIGVLPQHVNNWRHRGVPADRCINIESATAGAVTRYQLRPDVFGKHA